MTYAQSVVEKWLSFSKYDPEQKRFDMLSSNYVMHNATKLMEQISEFDPSCTISALYAKRVCQLPRLNA